MWVRENIIMTAIAELMHNCFEIARPLVHLLGLQRMSGMRKQEMGSFKTSTYRQSAGFQKRIQALNSTADIYVINRENTKWLVDYYKKNWPFDMVVLDELSSFKSPKAQRFKALRKVRPFVKRVVGLTGTPAPNGLIDLWSQVYLLDSGQRLGKTLTGYRERYFLPDKRNHNIIFTYKLKEGAEKAIYNKLSDICISMKSGDYLNIPERIDNIVPVQLPTRMEKYQQLERI